MTKTKKIALLLVAMLVLVVALTACNKFTAFTVKFEVNGGSEIADIKVESLEDFKMPADPTREGFAFKGWYADKALETKFEIANVEPVDGVVTAYAKWSQTAFTMTFDTGVEGATAKPVSVEKGEKFTAPSLTKYKGMTLVGWYTSTDDDAKKVNFNKPASEDVTVYAKWAYAVSLDHNNFSYKVDEYFTEFVTEPGTETTFTFDADSMPTYHNYEIARLYTKDSRGNKTTFVSGETVIKANTEVFVEWDYPEVVTLSFDTGFEGVTVADIRAPYNAKFTEPTKPVVEGLTFAGWYTKTEDADGEVKYNRFGFGDWAKYDMTVYAKWVYTVTLEFNNGVDEATTIYSNSVTEVGGETTVNVYSNNFIGVKNDPFTRTGEYYTLDENDNQVPFIAGETVITGDVTIYTIWNIVTLSFDTGIEGVTVADIRAPYNAKFTEPTKPVVEGLTFAGWYTKTEDADGEVKYNHFGFADWAKEDMTVYAKWVYAVTLEYNNFSGDNLVIFTDAVTEVGEQSTATLYKYFISGVTCFDCPMTGFYTLSGETKVPFVFVTSDMDKDAVATAVTSNVTVYIEWEGAPEITVDDTGALTKVVANDVANLVIPSTINGVDVTSIATNAIFMQNGLVSLVIPESVITLQMNAVLFNADLTTVEFAGEGIKTLTKSAFATNGALVKVFLPANITSLAYDAFTGCATDFMVFSAEEFASLDEALDLGTTKIAYGATSINDLVVEFMVRNSVTTHHFEATVSGGTVPFYAGYHADIQTTLAWYTDADLTTEFDFATPITESIKLYGEFQAK